MLRLTAAGRSNQRIAHDLVVLDTVSKHVTHVLAKLGATNRTEAVARARDLGLIPTPPPSRAGSTLVPAR
jgi:LuxR family maltose regulon positive regulatory protein